MNSIVKMQAKHILISGRVQGVGYRHFTLTQAQELGVYGWVRNLPDGRVEVMAKGKQESLDQFLQKLKQGPTRSTVEHLEISEISSEKVASNKFVIL